MNPLRPTFSVNLDLNRTGEGEFVVAEEDEFGVAGESQLLGTEKIQSAEMEGKANSTDGSSPPSIPAGSIKSTPATSSPPPAVSLLLLEAAELSIEEAELLQKLEKQNNLINSDPKSSVLESAYSHANSLCVPLPPKITVPTLLSLSSPSDATLQSSLFSAATTAPPSSSLQHFAHGKVAADAAINAAHLEYMESVDWEFWGRLLHETEATVKKQGKLVLKRIQQGLPKPLRGTLWHHFCHTHPSNFITVATTTAFKKLSSSSTASLSSTAASTTTGSTASNPIPTPAPVVMAPYLSLAADHFVPSSAFKDIPLEELYVELIRLSSPYEKMIMRDLSRTFPKHAFFSDAAGVGQESLFNVMKAYSLYDPVVGYCQGLSFIVGCFLLNVCAFVSSAL